MAARLSDVDRFLFFTPDDAGTEFAEAAANGWTLVPQTPGDLGVRMRAAFDELLVHRACDAAVLVGSDIPFLSSRDISDALQALHAHGGIVIGPADDGGYYLIGMTQVHASVFERITWGSSSVLADTLTRAREAGVATRLIGRTFDVDTIDDLRRAARDLVAAPADTAPNLRAWLRHEFQIPNSEF